MTYFIVQKLDRRHSGNRWFKYRAETKGTVEGVKSFVEARSYLWQVLGASADLEELYMAYGHSPPVWCWRASREAGWHLCFKSDKEVGLFLLKYAGLTKVDRKIKF